MTIPGMHCWIKLIAKAGFGDTATLKYTYFPPVKLTSLISRSSQFTGYYFFYKGVTVPPPLRFSIRLSSLTRIQSVQHPIRRITLLNCQFQQSDQIHLWRGAVICPSKLLPVIHPHNWPSTLAVHFSIYFPQKFAVHQQQIQVSIHHKLRSTILYEKVFESHRSTPAMRGTAVLYNSLSVPLLTACCVPVHQLLQSSFSYRLRSATVETPLSIKTPTSLREDALPASSLLIKHKRDFNFECPRILPS